MATLGDIGNALIDNGVTRWAKRAGEKIAGATIPGTSGAVPVAAPPVPTPPVPGAAIDLSNVSANPRVGGVGAGPVAQAATYTPPAPGAAPTQSNLASVRAAINGPNTTDIRNLIPSKEVVGKAGSGLGSMARGAGVASLAEGAVRGFNTTNDEYAQRMGIDAPTSNVGGLALRTAGVASDIGAAAINAPGNIAMLAPNVLNHGVNFGNYDQLYDVRNTFADVQAGKVSPVAPVVPAAVAPKDDPTKGWTQPAPVAAAPDISQAPLNRGRSKDGQIVISNTLPANFDVGNSTSEQIRSAGFEGMERQSKLDRANGVVPNLTGNRPSGANLSAPNADTGVGGGARGGRPARPVRVDPYEQEANDNATMARARAAGFDPASTTAPKKPTNYGAIHENPAFSAKQREEDEKYDAQKAGYDLAKSGGGKRPANIVKMEQLRDDLAYEAKYGDVGTFLAAKAAMKEFTRLDTNNASRENTRLREAGDANAKLADAMKGQTEAATKAAEAYIKGTVPKIMVDGKQVDDPNYEPLVRRIISEDGYDPGNLSPQDQADISNAAALSLKAHKQNQKWYDFLPGVTNSSQGPTSNLDDLVPTKTSRRWNGLGSEYDTKAGTLDIRTLTQPEIDLAERFKTNSYKAERNQRKERMAARQAKRKPE